MLGHVGETDEVVAHGAQTRQDLSEGRDDEVLAMTATHKQTHSLVNLSTFQRITKNIYENVNSLGETVVSIRNLTICEMKVYLLYATTGEVRTYKSSLTSN